MQRNIFTKRTYHHKVMLISTLCFILLSAICFFYFTEKQTSVTTKSTLTTSNNEVLPVISGNNNIVNSNNKTVYNAVYNDMPYKNTVVTDTEIRELSAFTKISVDIPVTINIKVGAKSQIQLSGDSSVLSQIKSDVYGDMLHISADNFNSISPITIIIESPMLTYVETSGATIGTITVNQSFIELNLSNASQIDLTGKTDKLKLTLTNASNIRANDFITKQAIVELRNASNASLNVTQSILGNILNASNLLLSGSAVAEIQISDTSTVKKQ